MWTVYCFLVQSVNTISEQCISNIHTSETHFLIIQGYRQYLFNSFFQGIFLQ